MDELTRLKIGIAHSTEILDRLNASGLTTERERQHAEALKRSIGRKRLQMQRLDRWLGR